MRRASLVFVALLLFGLVFILTSRREGIRYHLPHAFGVNSASTTSSTTAASPEVNRHLWVVTPASSPSPNLCKTLISSAILGYPEANVVNWQHEFDNPKVLFGGSHIGKIEGISGFLEAINRSNIATSSPGHSTVDDDLVLVIDAYDVWFQLPPEVLIKRYHRINREADQRLKAHLGDKVVSGEPRIRQSVIFSTQKKCWPTPEVGSDPRCFALPDSPVASDIYGSQTDVEHPDDPAHQFHDNRPRNLNSGSAIGRLGDMKSLFRRANEKVKSAHEAGHELFSDQGVFAEILGEQEVGREWTRRLHSPNDRGSFLDDKDLNVQSVVQALEQGEKIFEFGIGLDYRQELFVPTVFSEDDAQFLIHSNHASIRKASEEVNISPPRVSTLDADFARLQRPWLLDEQARLAAESVNGTVPDSNTSSQSWADIPLYTNLYTSVVPVGIHHNAWADGLKERLSTFWGKPWYAPHLRGLLAAHIVAPVQPLATVQAVYGDSGDTGTGEHTYWPPFPHSHARCARIFDPDHVESGSEGLSWDDVCSSDEIDWAEEVFRDGKGPWRTPQR